MIEQLLPRLRSPITGAHPLRLDPAAEIERAPTVGLITGTLVGPNGQDPSQVELGIWHAMGRHSVPRSLLQLSNVVVPVSELYEAVWRRRSTEWMSRRPFPIDEEVAEIVDALGRDVTGACVADVGCSEGLYSRELAKRGALVAGVDHSRPFLRRLLHHSAKCGVQVAAVRAVAECLPFADGQVDGVVIGGSLNEFVDRSAALSEVSRVLRPGGRLFMMSLVSASAHVPRLLQHSLRLGGITFPTAEATVAECADQGLKIVDQRLDGIVLRLTAERLATTADASGPRPVLRIKRDGG